MTGTAHGKFEFHPTRKCFTYFPETKCVDASHIYDPSITGL